MNLGLNGYSVGPLSIVPGVGSSSSPGGALCSSSPGGGIVLTSRICRESFSNRAGRANLSRELN